MASRYCGNCGAPVASGSAFREACGKPVGPCWSVDIRIDPLDEPSFTNVFTLEVNGATMDSSTVT